MKVRLALGQLASRPTHSYTHLHFTLLYTTSLHHVTAAAATRC